MPAGSGRPPALFDTDATTRLEPLSTSFNFVTANCGESGLIDRFVNRSTLPLPRSRTVRLNEVVSAAGTPSRSTSTTMPLPHAPVLDALSTSATFGAGGPTPSIRLIVAATASDFGTRTTRASDPPLRKNCCTAKLISLSRSIPPKRRS